MGHMDTSQHAGTAATGTETEELPYEDTALTLDLEPGPPPERFTVEHLLYLYGRRLIAVLPTELAPFPVPVQPGPVLRDQLIEWNILDSTGTSLAPDAEELLTALSCGWVFAVWGQTRFPARTFTQHLDIPAEAADWGLFPTTDIVPRIPFLVAAHEQETIAAVSTPEALLTSRMPRRKGRDHEVDVADELRHLLDPAEVWSPSPRPRIRVRRTLIDALTAHPILGSVTTEYTERTVRAEMAKLAEDHHLSVATVDTLLELVTAPVAAVTQWVVSVTTATGTVTSQGSGGAVLFHGDGTATVTYPVTSGPVDDVIFEPATTESLTAAIRAVRKDAAKAPRGSAPLFDNAEQSVWL